MIKVTNKNGTEVDYEAATNSGTRKSTAKSGSSLKPTRPIDRLMRPGGTGPKRRKASREAAK